MDISKKYIEMCEKAGEIQKDHRWQVGDYSQSGIFHEWIQAVNKHTRLWHDIYGNYELEDEVIWLPRQDQLQEIIIADEGCKGKDKVYWKINWFWEFVQDTCFTGGEDYGNYTNQAFPTMEQLWLAFVMKEKYNKIWNGKRWI